MRHPAILLLLASLSACHPSTDNGSIPAGPEAASPDVAAAAVSFDGADYQDAAAKLAHGKRLADVLDCTGCHGDNLQGQNVTADDPSYGDMNAPNLTLKMADYSDADFEKLLRTGVPKDGRDFYFMPPESFQFLSSEDMAALLAYLRSFKPAGAQLPPIRKGAGFLKERQEGEIADAAKQVIRYRDNPPMDLGPSYERGRRLTQMSCTECHNSALQGYAGFTPNLDIAGAYGEAELTALLTSGKGKAKPDLGLMTAVAKHSFSQLTPGERKAIVDYVLTRANQPQRDNDGRD